MSRLDPNQWTSAAYPHRPGHVHGSPTSRAAADSIRPKALGTLHRAVYAHIKACGGCTDEEGQREMQLGQNTYRPRRRELELQGYVRDSGSTRPTSSGRPAVVWVITDKGRGV